MKSTKVSKARVEVEGFDSKMCVHKMACKQLKKGLLPENKVMLNPFVSNFNIRICLLVWGDPIMPKKKREGYWNQVHSSLKIPKMPL